MSIHELAGKPAPKAYLANIPRTITQYFAIRPNPENPLECVSFGTSGHRGIPEKATFNEYHIRAITQAVCDYRKRENITGPLFIGMDSHALSEAAFCTAVEVLVANGVDVIAQKGLTYTPTPVISHAILNYNRDIKDFSKLSDGIIITPSHNPPQYGGFKYNPPTGGPAGTGITKAIENDANNYLKNDLRGVQLCHYGKAILSVKQHDFILPYVEDLKNIIDMDLIAKSNLKLGVNPLGGSTLDFWHAIADYYKLNLEVLDPYIDHTFSFMTLDHDGKIRMDCSSPYAMASLISLRNNYDLAFGNDPDGDRHGIVTRQGLMNPNHFLAVLIDYLFTNRPDWPNYLQVGKTLVSSALIDKVANSIGRKVCEVPVGFKYFVDGLFDKTLGFGGEESAGASFLRKNGTVWSTDKDGMIPCLAAAEMMARTEKSPSDIHEEHVRKFGLSYYGRRDSAVDPVLKKLLANLSPSQVHASEIAGETIQQTLTNAPGNNAPIGGLKLVTENGWVAIRPSGTEDIYKIYAESFKSQDHLNQILDDAQNIVTSLI